VAFLRSFHGAELAAMDAGDAIVPRQPLIDEGVVGREQIKHVAVFADDDG
jgi:hypothetical protein